MFNWQYFSNTFVSTHNLNFGKLTSKSMGFINKFNVLHILQEYRQKAHIMFCFRNEELFVLNNISLGYNNHH